MSNIETRSFDFVPETREEQNAGIVEGTPIVFNQRTDIGGMFFEEIAPEALDAADLKDVRLCLNHDTSYVYARSRNNNENSTMQLMTGEGGLSFRANLAINDSPRAKDLYSAIRRGDIDKMSFMFTVNRDEWQDLETDHPVRIIRGIDKVFEVSAVTFPAYDGTSISARSEGDALESAKASLESARKQLEEDRAAKEYAERREALLAELKGVQHDGTV